MLDSFTFWFVILALLVIYLCVSVGLRYRARLRAEQARSRALEREYGARGLDTSSLAPRIKRVRQDHAASAHVRSRPLDNHLELLAAARRFVTGFAYFHRKAHEDELKKDIT
jgi:hypothetical protein